MKILIDMNLSPDWVQALTSAGHDAIHWNSVGDPGATDEVIFAWAQQHGHVVFTHDLDFGTILATTGAKTPSVIQLRMRNILPDAASSIVLDALKQFESELSAGALITIDIRRARARILPIHRRG